MGDGCHGRRVSWQTRHGWHGRRVRQNQHALASRQGCQGLARILTFSFPCHAPGCCSGGLGQIDHSHLYKNDPELGMLVVSGAGGGWGAGWLAGAPNPSCQVLGPPRAASKQRLSFHLHQSSLQ